MTLNAHIGHLPAELRELKQWCIAGYDKAPLSITANGTLIRASVTEPSQWLNFDTAVQIAQNYGLGVGFVLQESDPFSCIDLDVKDYETNPNDPNLWTTPEQFDLFYRIMLEFDSYTESSRSGKGLHIWLRGKIGKGLRRDGVEIYSQERFIICTGKIVQNKPIRDAQAMLTRMASQMQSKAAQGNFELEEVPENEDDWYVLERAVNAANSEKFCQLWLGNWQDLGFPSQSEADLALLSMFTFYSESNAQCRRLFRDSALGKREKAVKNDRYLNLTLKIIRQREAAEQSVDHSAIALAADTVLTERQLALAEVARLQGGYSALDRAASRLITPLHVQGTGEPEKTLTAPPIAFSMASPVSEEVLKVGAEGLPWPPGFGGKIAQFIYQSAPRPVKEVAIVAALGLLAGICGKAWHIPQSGLNLYIILVARSAIGKEAMHSGISAIIRSCSYAMPRFHTFINFAEFASGPALIKECAKNASFVNVSGEWGRRMKRLSHAEQFEGPLSTLRTQMTNLYQKSGPQAIVGGIGYSNKDDNIASISGVAYSMIGETTPNTFYESLTDTMMEDGFLSRFLIIEYTGDRPVSNLSQILTPDESLRDALVKLATHADRSNNEKQSHPVGRSEQAARLMSEFEQLCDNKINGTTDESYRQMWNRAALKVLRVSALLAVADNFMFPCIEEAHVKWALDVVYRDIGVMSRRLESGDIGMSDSSRERKIISILRKYINEPVPIGYKIPVAMRDNGIVPRSFIQLRVAKVAAFYNHRMGQNVALDLTLQSCLSNGYIMEVDKSKMIEAYNYHGKAYRILKLPDYSVTHSEK